MPSFIDARGYDLLMGRWSKLLGRLAHLERRGVEARTGPWAGMAAPG